MIPLPEKFVNLLNKQGLKRRPLHQDLYGLRVFYLDLSPLRIKFSDQSPIIEITRTELETRSAEEIMGTIRQIILHLQIGDRIPIALVEGSTDGLRPLANQPPYYVVTLGEDDMARISESRAPADELLARIRGQVPLAFLSPYEVSAAVTGPQFFGRDYEVRTILSHPETCYTVIGTRRIGKTSVLKEVQRRMQQEVATENNRFLYYDCMGFEGREDFFARVIGDLYPKEFNRMWRMGTSYSTYFTRFMQQMRKRYGGPIVLFMDEIDQMLRSDRQRDYEIVRTLRACFEEGSCRFIFAGFRGAQRELGIHDSPLNFSTSLMLGNFNYHQAAELIGVPMENLGVCFVQKDQVIRRILRDTAGHPNFVQHYCLSLIRQLDETGTREIAVDHLTRLVDDEGFRARVLETFVFNTNDLEKAVAYAIADRETFGIDDVDKQMKRHRLFLDTAELEDACRKLELLGVIDQQGQVYHFTIPAFPQLLRERYGSEFLFSKAGEFRTRSKRGED